MGCCYTLTIPFLWHCICRVFVLQYKKRLKYFLVAEVSTKKVVIHLERSKSAWYLPSCLGVLKKLNHAVGSKRFAIISVYAVIFLSQTNKEYPLQLHSSHLKVLATSPCQILNDPKVLHLEEVSSCLQMRWGVIQTWLIGSAEGWNLMDEELLGNLPKFMAWGLELIYDDFQHIPFCDSMICDLNWVTGEFHQRILIFIAIAKKNTCNNRFHTTTMTFLSFSIMTTFPIWWCH